MPKTAKTAKTTPVKTVSPVTQMLETIRQKQSKIIPATLPDIILSHLNPTPTHNYEYKSAMANAARLLAPGAEYHDLVGKVIFPAPRKYGPPPKWAIVNGVPVPEMNSIVPMPDWTTSTELVTIYQKFTSLGVVMTDTERLAISKMGRKNYEVTTSLLEKGAEKAKEEALLRRDAESELERSERALFELKLEFEDRLVRIANSSAMAAVKAALDERSQQASN